MENGYQKGWQSKDGFVFDGANRARCSASEEHAAPDEDKIRRWWEHCANVPFVSLWIALIFPP